MRVQNKSLWRGVMALLLLLLLLCNATEVLCAGREALLLCYRSVIPALFPFLVLARLLTEGAVANVCVRFLSPIMKPIFRVEGVGALPLMVGVVSGYPVGAKTVAGLYREGKLSRKDAMRLIPFCNNAGPLFVIGAVGTGLLGSTSAGAVLYIVHILCAFGVGIVFRLYSEKSSVKETNFTQPKHRSQAENRTFAALVADSVQTMVLICGYVVLFAIIGAVVMPLAERFLPSYAVLLLRCFLEVTNGAASLAASQLPPRLLLTALAFCIGIGGVCVLLQVSAVLDGTDLTTETYCLGKLLQGILSAVIIYVIFPYIPQEAQSVFAGLQAATQVQIWEQAAVACNGVIFGVSLVLFLSQSNRRKV